MARLIQAIDDHLPTDGSRDLQPTTRLEADIGIHPTLIPDLLDDVEDAFDVKVPDVVRMSLPYRLATNGGSPVLFQTAGLTIGDLLEAAGSGVWPARLYEIGQAPSA